MLVNVVSVEVVSVTVVSVDVVRVIEVLARDRLENTLTQRLQNPPKPSLRNIP